MRYNRKRERKRASEVESRSISKEFNGDVKEGSKRREKNLAHILINRG